MIAIFPEVAFKNGMLLLGFGLLTAVYGAFMAMRAKDIKKLLAFSSMGHLGLAVAGIFTLNVEVFPAVLVMLVGHGLSASALFILSGSAERFAGHRCLDKMGGFASRYPVFGFFFGVASILAIAIPGTVGFVGEFLVLLGLWGVSKVAAVVAGLCIILTGVYMLRLIQKVLFGEPGEISEDQKKLRFPIADAVATAPLLILLIVFGVFPLPITSSLDYTRVTEDQQAEIEAAIEAASQPAAVAEMTEQVSAEPVSADTAAVEAQVVTEAEEKAVAETATAEQEVKQVEAEDVR